MGINSPLRGEQIDLVIGISYNRTQSRAGADLTLLVVNAIAELLRPVFGVWRRVAQIRVRHGVTQTRVRSLHFFFGREVRVLVETRPSR